MLFELEYEFQYVWILSVNSNSKIFRNIQIIRKSNIRTKTKNECILASEHAVAILRVIWECTKWSNLFCLYGSQPISGQFSLHLWPPILADFLAYMAANFWPISILLILKTRWSLIKELKTWCSLIKCNVMKNSLIKLEVFSCLIKWTTIMK